MLYAFFPPQSSYDYSERSGGGRIALVNYRSFVEKLEEMTQPVIKKYLSTSDDD